MLNMALETEKLLTQFQIQGRIGEIEGFGSGHINDTFKVTNAVPGQPDYLLQRINHQVFPQVGPMMDNILRVTEHLKQKSSGDYTSLTIIPAYSGELYIQDDIGNYWRVYLFMNDLISHQ